MAFAAPDLTAALASATTKNQWGPAASKQAADWFVNFLQAVYKAPAGTVINVMSKKADDLWHEYLNDPNYDSYCQQCFGYVLQHIETPPRRKPTAAEEAAVEPYYRPNWPIPDSIVSCHA
ncbi:MAG TPA: hypothetical protein VKE27_04090 [Candidatus Dormibacteraeota bacterium]|nr:hypothetical protein [Candidatus Dormibacteraeota bacterium]